MGMTAKLWFREGLGYQVLFRNKIYKVEWVGTDPSSQKSHGGLGSTENHDVTIDEITTTEVTIEKDSTKYKFLNMDGDFYECKAMATNRGGLGTSVCAYCGDGFMSGWEDCDDGNLANGDGCSNICTIEDSYTCDTATQPNFCGTCGNGIKEGLEECDDGNQVGGDGCSMVCNIELGFMLNSSSGLVLPDPA